MYIVHKFNLKAVWLITILLFSYFINAQNSTNDSIVIKLNNLDSIEYSTIIINDISFQSNKDENLIFKIPKEKNNCYTISSKENFLITKCFDKFIRDTLSLDIYKNVLNDLYIKPLKKVYTNKKERKIGYSYNKNFKIVTSFKVKETFTPKAIEFYIDNELINHECSNEINLNLILLDNNLKSINNQNNQIVEYDIFLDNVRFNFDKENISFKKGSTYYIGLDVSQKSFNCRKSFVLKLTRSNNTTYLNKNGVYKEFKAGDGKNYNLMFSIYN